MLDRPDAQVVFVDTPGHPQAAHAAGRAAQRHRPATPSATSTWWCLMVDATAPVGRGDEWVAARCRRTRSLVVNKVDKVDRDAVAEPAAAGAGARAARVLPDLGPHRRRRRRARRGHLSPGCPRGRGTTPRQVTDVPEAFWVAELVREQLLAVAREELPHSIATRCDGVGVAPDPRRDPRRARLPEGHRDRQGRLGAQGGRHPGARAAPRGRLRRAVRQGRQGLAAPAKSLERSATDRRASRFRAGVPTDGGVRGPCSPCCCSARRRSPPPAAARSPPRRRCRSRSTCRRRRCAARPRVLLATSLQIQVVEVHVAVRRSSWAS